MRVLKPSLIALSLLIPAAAQAGPTKGKKPAPAAPAAPAPAPAAPAEPAPAATPAPAAPAATDDKKPEEKKPEEKKPKGELEDLLNQASATAAERPVEKPAAPPPEAKKPTPAPAAKPATPPPAAPPAKPAEPQAPPTDDNDATAEAAPPAPLQAVQQTGEVRRRGPYELGPLDCRVLDGAGIERVLPNRIVAGEEPDILCRVLITQPANVATLPHNLTLTVNVGERETLRQVRNVRISSVGRRSLVFIVPADKIASDDPAQVRIQAVMSAPANPQSGRLVKFVVENED